MNPEDFTKVLPVTPDGPAALLSSCSTGFWCQHTELASVRPSLSKWTPHLMIYPNALPKHPWTYLFFSTTIFFLVIPHTACFHHVSLPTSCLAILYLIRITSRLSWQNWTWHNCWVQKTIKTAGFAISGSSCPLAHNYHLVQDHLRTMESRPVQSQILPEAYSPDDTENKRQTKYPTLKPSDILKRFHSL